MKRLLYITLSLVTIWTLSRCEIVLGQCQDSDQNGRIFTNSEYNYISYRDTDAKPGDIVITFDLLNPFNNYCDDIVFRADKVIRK